MINLRRYGLRATLTLLFASLSIGAHGEQPPYHFQYVALDQTKLPAGFLFFDPKTIDDWGRVFGDAYKCTSETCEEILPYLAVYRGGRISLLTQRPSFASVNASDSLGTIGGSVLTDPATFTTQAALFRGHSVKLIPRRPGEVASFVTAISKLGTALVESYDAAGQLTYLLYSGGRTTPINLNSLTHPVVTGMNDWAVLSGTENSASGGLGFRLQFLSHKLTLLHPVSPDPHAWGLGINNRGDVLGYSFVAGARERIGVWDWRGRFNTYFIEGIPQFPTVSNRLVFNDGNLILITLISRPQSEVGKSYLVPRPGVRLDLASLVDGLPQEEGPLLFVVDVNNLGDIIGVGQQGSAFLLKRDRNIHDGRPHLSSTGEFRTAPSSVYAASSSAATNWLARRRAERLVFDAVGIRCRFLKLAGCKAQP